MTNGFVNVDKPEGMTSSDVVCIVRGIVSQATGERCKAGHLGTLDPAASGVLPVALGKATRLFDYLLRKNKTYTARFRFGETTDTLDRAGKITNSGGRVPAIDEIADALKDFEGYVDQLPPEYSAKSVNGKRAYDLAREGKPVQLAPKTVFVSFKSVKPTENAAEYDFDIACGAGTYIRALARDLAAKLGTFGHVTALRRTSSGVFDVADAVALRALERNPAAYVLPVDFPLADCVKAYLPKEFAARAKNGVAVDLSAARVERAGENSAHDDDGIAVYGENGDFIGMGAVDGEILKMRAVLC